MGGQLELDELVEHFTLLPDEVALLRTKSGATRLGFAVLLTYFTRAGRFPSGRSAVADEAVEFVARQVGVPASELGFYDWSGRQIKAHRAEIRQVLGFRECGVTDADKLTDWLVAHVAESERRPEMVREVLLERCRSERIEPPARGRCDRMVASALHRAEDALFTRVAGRLPEDVVARIRVLITDTATSVEGVDDEEGGEPGDRSLLSLIKADPGNVSLESMLTEIDKLLAARAIALPAALFADVAPKVIARWRGQAAVESPSHLRAHPNPAKTLCLLAALLHAREREITDALVELLIATVHRINARAERRVTQELINAFRRVTGKENILFGDRRRRAGRAGRRRRRSPRPPRRAWRR